MCVALWIDWSWDRIILYDVVNVHPTYSKYVKATQNISRCSFISLNFHNCYAYFRCYMQKMNQSIYSLTKFSIKLPIIYFKYNILETANTLYVLYSTYTTTHFSNLHSKMSTFSLSQQLQLMRTQLARYESEYKFLTNVGTVYQGKVATLGYAVYS